MPNSADHPNPPTETPAPQASPQRWRLGWVALGTFVGGLALGEMSGWPFLRGPLEQAINSASDTPVTLGGRFRARLLVSPHLAIERITIAPGGGVDVPHLLKAQGLDVHWRWADLFRAWQGEALRVKSLTAQSLDAHLVRLNNQATSWDVLPRRASEDTDAAPAPLPSFEHLALDTGHIEWRDEPGDTRIGVDIHIDPAAKDRLPWQATASGQYQGHALRAQAETTPEMPLLLQGPASKAMVPLKASGSIGKTHWAFDGRAGAIWAGQDLEGQVNIDGPSLQATGQPLGVVLPETPPYRLDAKIQRSGAQWHLSTDDATIGSSALTADLRFDSAAQPPLLKGTLGGRRLALADLGPAVGADQPPRKAGRVLPDAPFDVPTLGQMDADVRIALDQLDFGTPTVAPVRKLTTQLRLQNSQLSLSKLSAGVAGGTLSGETSLKVVDQMPQWDASLQLSGVDLDSWIRGLRKGDPGTGSGASAERGAYMSGTLKADVTLTGQGRSVAAILGSANGQLGLSVSQGRLSHLVTEAAGLDVAQALGMLITGDEAMPLGCAVARAVVQDGVVKSRQIVLDNADSTLRVQGGASFKTEALALRLVAQPKDFSLFSLRTPVTVGGHFGQPEVGIEAKGLLARAAGAVALGSLAPPASLLAFIDTGSGNEAPPCPPTSKAPN